MGTEKELAIIIPKLGGLKQDFQTYGDRLLKFMETDIMAAFDNLRKEVRENRDAVDSVLLLIKGLSDRLRSASGSEEEINQIAADLDAQQARLAQAVVENTPAEPDTNPPNPNTPTPVEPPSVAEEPAPAPSDPLTGEPLPGSGEPPVVEPPSGSN